MGGRQETGRGLAGAPYGKGPRVEILVAVIVLVALAVPTAIVAGLFVWGAIQDGRADRRTQARLGIRRRTRLGR